MVIKKFKSAITYFNVMISSFSSELPLVRRQMRGGGGWVQGKNRDPFLAGTRLKFRNIVLSASIMIQENKGSWLQFSAILPETQTFGFLMEMKSNF